MDFSPTESVDLMIYINRFSNVKPVLHPWNKRGISYNIYPFFTFRIYFLPMFLCEVGSCDLMVSYSGFRINESYIISLRVLPLFCYMWLHVFILI